MLYAGMPFDNDYQEAQVVDLIARQKSLNLNRAASIYSNSGYFLLSEIVERASGKACTSCPGKTSSSRWGC